jgi:nucleoside 2-deoxyribosyltransferase
MSTQKTLKIYLAGGWFTPEQEKVLTIIENVFKKKLRLQVYSPRREMLLTSGEKFTKEVRQHVFKENLKQIDASDLIIASTEGKDMGTIFECGYAFANHKRIFYIYLDKNTKGFNLMLSESGKGVITNELQLEKLAGVLDEEGLLTDNLKQFEYNEEIE